jgi:DNA repair protein RecO (recombination protein O)
MTTKHLNLIILSRKNYGEADKLVFAFSREEGRIKIKAKGCRRIKSRLACHIEPFCVGRYYLVEGKGGYILAGDENVIQNSHITKDIETYKDASYVCELLQLAFSDSEPNANIYDLTKEVLSLMDSLGPEKRKIVLRYYEFKLLSETGYRANYQNCKKCGKDISEVNIFIGDYEGVYCSECTGEGKEINLHTLKILRIFNTEPIQNILNIKYIEKYSSEIKEVTFSYLCDILPKIPKAEEL